MKKTINLVLLSFLFSSLLSMAAGDEKVRLQLKWFSSFQFAGYYMALEKGFYSEAGLDVSILERIPQKNNIVQVINGEAEYGVADSALLLYYNLQIEHFMKQKREEEIEFAVMYN